MPLTVFIQHNRAKIIADWIKFAATLLPWAEGLTEKELKDHADELLTAVIRDMNSPQSRSEQSEKSKGNSEVGDLGKVGQTHASERLESGLNLDQLVSEYRALRASVLRLWEQEQGEKQSEVTRFNEAIDEALCESTARYSETVNTTREHFLAILGHDLRNPLAAITLGSQQLTSASGLDEQAARIAKRIASSAWRMTRMVNDLLDLTRSRLGTGIPVTLQPVDLTPICQQVVSEMQVVHPDCKVQFESNGNLSGEWDPDRLAQVISNLVANALQYGSAHGPVGVVAQEHDDEVVLRVQNRGPVIPQSTLKRIFDPLVRQPPENGDNNKTGLGLGLYIVREIVTAHGGTVEVASTDKEGTTFSVQIPRRPSSKPIHKRN